MKLKKKYFSLISYRKLRRRIRRISYKWAKEIKPLLGVKIKIIYKDKNGSNILKSRRIKSRIF